MKVYPRQNVWYYKRNGNFASCGILPGLLCFRGKAEKVVEAWTFFNLVVGNTYATFREKARKICAALQ